VLQVNSTPTVLVSVDRNELVVHLVRGVLSADNVLSRSLHVVELPHKDGREASLNVFFLCRVELKAEFSIILDDIEEQ
jgi:hypothetical protein